MHIKRMQSLPRKFLIGFVVAPLAFLVTTGSSAQTSATPSGFEVAAIKLNQSGSGSSDSNTNNGRFTASNITLKSLMAYQAYAIPANRILDGPKWLGSTHFDIQAKMEDDQAEHLQALTRDQRRLETQIIFQQFLADRFHLVVHWETRELPVYALIVGKKGSQLQPTKDSTGGTSISSNGSRSSSQFTAKGVTLPDLATAMTRELSGELGRDIVDKTGIEGKYDLTLKWSRDALSTEGVSTSETFPSLFTAIQEQLGLRLDPRKAPVRVLVVDHAELPSGN
jgi:uncharacterized protein (TIGR03435 family)